MEGTFITVVHTKRGILVPFEVSERTGEIILCSGWANEEQCFVSRINTKYIDWDLGYISEEEVV